MATPFAEVIGDPVAHSKSPAIHRFWLDALGIEGDYIASHVRPEELDAHFARRRAQPEWRGCNVTVPHKQAVIPLLDSLSPLAESVGAVNLIVPQDGLAGTNSDVDGIMEPLPFAPGSLHSVCLIGSGGAALAALAAFRRLSVRRVTLNVRDQAKGERLLESWGFEGRVGPIDDAANLGQAQLIVNATTLGMAGQTQMPQPLLDCIADHPDKDAVLFEMVYAPLETEALAAARRRGLRTVDGLQMLVGQAASAFQAFFGAPAPRERDAELRALLTS
jgi:shikimate dehydrogenase